MGRKSKSGLPANVKSIRGELFFDKLYKGTRYYVTLGLKDTKAQHKLADWKIAMIVAAMKVGSFNPNDYPLLKKYHTAGDTSSVPTLEDQIDIWIARKRDSGDIGAGTEENYRGQLKPFVSILGLKPITFLNRNSFEAAIKEALEHRGAARGELIKGVQHLKTIWDDAEDDYPLQPIHKVKLKKERVVKEIKPFATLEEASALYYRATKRMAVQIAVMFLAGLRKGEALALRWTDIDFNTNRLTVVRTLSDKEFGAVKTNAGVRIIKMHPCLVRILAEWRAANPHEDLLFTSGKQVRGKGKPIRVHTFDDREFRTLVTTTEGVRYLTSHAFRRGNATYRMACNDYVTATLLDELGHVDLEITLKHYAKAIDHLGIKWTEVVFPVPPKIVNAAA